MKAICWKQLSKTDPINIEAEGVSVTATYEGDSLKELIIDHKNGQLRLTGQWDTLKAFVTAPAPTKSAFQLSGTLCPGITIHEVFETTEAAHARRYELCNGFVTTVELEIEEIQVPIEA